MSRATAEASIVGGDPRRYTRRNVGVVYLTWAANVAERARMLTFRSATPADVELVMALVESAYRGDASRAGWTTEADLLDGQRTDRREVSELVADSAARIVLASEEGEVVACVLVRKEGDAGHIGMFAVRPTLQARGIGGALLACAEHVAREEYGATKTKMTVLEQRPELLAWYARKGYRDTGETEPFPYGNERFGLPRRDDLRFRVLQKLL
jgi:ribosomal protein S18 acetylase RimI-like enzyme